MPRWSWTLLLAALAVQASAHADDLASARTQFRVAYAAAQAGAPAAPDSGALRDYPLYPYLQAARLQRDLGADDAIRTYLDENGAAPHARSLRRAWLEDLARRRQWETYLAQYLDDVDGSTTLRCHSLAARAALGRDKGLEQDIVETWLAPQSLPDACDPAFDWLRSRRALTSDLIEQRARMALVEGQSSLARHLAKSLSASTAAPLVQWAALIEQPAKSIDVLIDEPGRRVEPAALLAGWTRLARAAPDRALATFEDLVRARDLSGRGASPYALATALGLAWSRTPGALDFFARVHPDDFDENAHEWHARAALWVGDWTRAARAIEAMPQVLREQNRWRYWAARTQGAMGNEAAKLGYATVVPTDNWYAALSAARLGERFTPSLQSLPLDPEQTERLGREPGFIRTRELLLCDLAAEAAAEWRAAYDTLAPAQQVQAVGLASRWGWHHQAIASAAQQALFNDYPLLYPRPYDREVGAASRLTNLPEELIYAVMRQESLYRADAGSSAGALGLMQLLPSTARRAARRWDLKAPTRTELLEPAVNVPIGAGELRSLVDRFAGQTLVATAGYNAGPAAARRWLPLNAMDTDVWVENIPFNETRAYVQRVAWHNLVFAWLLDRKPRDVSSWLGAVRLPAADAALEPVKP
jgi:soluble lytic murein transglycosylase